MEKTAKSRLASNKILASVMLIFAVFGFLIVIHRLSYYVFEYDAEFSPVDYGKFNILSFFTVQSNIFAYIYLFFASLAVFGVKSAKRFAFNPTVGLFVTTYIIIAGAVYCIGIPMGFTPPFKWDSAAHSMSSFIQIYYHMIMPPFMLALWLFPLTDRRLPLRKAWLAGIYPLLYSLFSIVRGAVSPLHFYPYPFYRPEFIIELFFGKAEYDTAQAYLLLPALTALLLLVGILLFIGAAMLLAALRNARIRRVF